MKKCNNTSGKDFVFFPISFFFHSPFCLYVEILVKNKEHRQRENLVNNPNLAPWVIVENFQSVLKIPDNKYIYGMGL